MTDLLLITDVPRLRKIFSRLSDNGDIRVRIANSLEKGGEELTAEKPAIVFVQTHLSGLSAEIILMHLKKQLGRKRSRFVLLATPAQAGSETIRLYQGHLDISLDDRELFYSIKDLITTLLAKPSKKVEIEAPAASELPAEPEPLEAMTVVENMPAVVVPPLDTVTVAPTATLQEEPSLVDQGLTYAPRPRMSVYSEFNSSFDSAVNNMQPAANLDEPLPEPKHDWDDHAIETIEASGTRSKRAVFLLWLAPVVIAVVVITVLQHKRSTPAPTAVVQKTPPAAIVPAAPAAPQPSATLATPAQPQKAAPTKPANEPDAALSDKAVLSAIAANRGSKEQARPAAASGRLTVLPDFIPRSALDKAYTNANPGWERYKGQVTEFKVFREGASIKAIQVIDRGGNGVPESFMKAALRQVSKNTTFVLESSEKKEGYEILRGHTADNLKVLYYRDDQGSKLRAFVLTWN